METESRYLKKIRDVLRKKNAGSSSGTIYSGPNTKAKYLNDIAKEVDKLDISGGGSSYESPFYIVRMDYSISGAYMIPSVKEVEDAIRNGKIVYFKLDNKLLPYSTTSKIDGVDYFIFKSIPTYISHEDADPQYISFTTTTIKVSKVDKAVSGRTDTSDCYVEQILTLHVDITF